MKISELVKYLQGLQEQYGDIRVCYEDFACGYDSYRCVDERNFKHQDNAVVVSLED